MEPENMNIILETERLLLRELTPEDANYFYLLNEDPEVLQYTGDLPFHDVSQAKDFLITYVEQYKKHKVGRWAMIEKENQQFIGWCGLKYSEDQDTYDIGFRLFRKYWNQGYATEAAQSCVQYGFQKLNIPKIIGRGMQANAASIRVLEKIGLQYKGNLDFDNQKGVLYSISNKNTFI